eukprot:gb/GECG01013052.1/.p1 GENE.gb/GECG01013052.1/~~gb/GECG01013052.1/.p1  ORF type:complete len:665 (+),score=42.18 gb/GECG01013052.1/:1-1995(+)
MGEQTLHQRRRSGRRPHEDNTNGNEGPPPPKEEEKHDESEDDMWCPSFHTALKLSFAVRCVGALWSILMDCDETFNFWEPVHFLAYGHGWQTWEYSPLFALRSYAYLMPHLACIWISGRLWGAGKLKVFYSARVLLGLTSAWCEAYLYEGIVRRFGRRVGLLFFVFLMASAGMYHSSVAFVPSTTAMYGMMLFFGALCREEHTKAFGIACAVVWITWPFAGLIFVIPGIYMLWAQSEQKINNLVVKSGVTIVLTSAACLGVSAYFDWKYYGKPCIAVWNIIRYNVLESDSEAGSELYGVEETTFYLKNLFLNFMCLPLAIFGVVLTPLLSFQQKLDAALARTLVCTLILWVGFMSTRPHKEERFMFPIYPLLAFAAAIGLEAVGNFVQYISGSSRLKRFIVVCALLGHAISGSSRIAGLRLHYGAPLAAWEELFRVSQGEKAPEGALSPTGADRLLASWGTKPSNTGMRVCAGKEWYRFPASFFLPDQVSPWIYDQNATVVKNPVRSGRLELRFVRSGFRGELPQEFDEENGTQGNNDGFNMYNREETKGRYVLLEDCDAIVDFKMPDQHYTAGRRFGDLNEHPEPGALEPWFTGLVKYDNGTMMNEEWVSIYRSQFLSPDETPILHRTFYIPIYSRDKKVFGWYHVLLRRTLARLLMPSLFAE